MSKDKENKIAIVSPNNPVFDKEIEDMRKIIGLFQNHEKKTGKIRQMYDTVGTFLGLDN